MNYLRFLLLAFVTTLLILLGNYHNYAYSHGKQIVAQNSEENVEYMTALGLMQGHLLVGKELLEEGKADQAEPHFGHPVEELYAEVETQLQSLNVPEFKTTLNQLHEQVKYAPDDPKVGSSYESAVEAINQAIAAIPAEKLQSPQFILATINGMLATAGEEYQAGILDGKVVEIIEYQDSRGFVIYGENLYQNIAQQMSGEYPEAHANITESLTGLKQAWPSVNPPDPVVKNPEEVTQLIEKIKENSEQVSS